MTRKQSVYWSKINTFGTESERCKLKKILEFENQVHLCFKYP